MTLNLIEKGIETYNNFIQKRLSENRYRNMKQSLTQVLYILLNSRGKEHLDNTIKEFITRKIKGIVETMSVRGLPSGQNHYHIASIALSLLCIASR